MTFEAEIEVLKRQNRRLKVALFSTILVFIVVVASVSGFTATRANQARAKAQAAQAAAQAEFENIAAQLDRAP